MLSSADVRSARFTATKFREGYEIPEVDQVLDAAADTLAHLERGQTVKADGSPLLTPNDLLAARFTTTRLREGYDVVEVDDLLDEIISTLNTYIARAQRGEPLTPVSAHEADEPQAAVVDAAPAAEVSVPSLATPAGVEDLGGPAAGPAAPVVEASDAVEPAPADAAPAEPAPADPELAATSVPDATPASPAEAAAPLAAAAAPAAVATPEPADAAPVETATDDAARAEEPASAASEPAPSEPVAESPSEPVVEPEGSADPLPWVSSLAETAARHSDAFVPQWAPTGVQPEPQAAPVDETPAPVTPVEEEAPSFAPTPAETPENTAPAVELPAWATSAPAAPEEPAPDAPAPVADDAADAAAPVTVDATDAPAPETTDDVAPAAEASAPQGAAPDATEAVTPVWSAPASQPWTPPVSSEWTATSPDLPAPPPIAADAFGVEEEAWAPVTAFEPVASAERAPGEPAPVEQSQPEAQAEQEAAPVEPEASAPAAAEPAPIEAEPIAPAAPAEPATWAPVTAEAQPEPAEAQQEPAATRLAKSTIESATAAAPAVEGLDSQAFLRQLTYARATSVGEAKEKLTFLLPDGTEVQAVRVTKSATGLVVGLG